MRLNEIIEGRWLITCLRREIGITTERLQLLSSILPEYGKQCQYKICLVKFCPQTVYPYKYICNSFLINSRRNFKSSKWVFLNIKQPVNISSNYFFFFISDPPICFKPLNK